MDFLSGFMLWGAAAAAIPVVLHLTGRAKPAVHRFSAMRFLLASQRRSAGLMRLKHLLLLLLRMLVLALLAFAMARPLLSPAAGWGPDEMQGRLRGDFVLVLDASLSMQYRETDRMRFALGTATERTRFELARDQALRLLDRLSPDSRAALLRGTEQAEALQGRLTMDHALLRRSLLEARPSGRGLRAERVLAAAHALLEREPELGTPRFVVFFTDLQRSGYAGAPEGGGVAPRPNLVLVDVGSEGADNGAVLEATLPGAALAAGRTLSLSARVRPLDPEHPAPVRLLIDGQVVDQRPTTPAGAAKQEAQFSFPAGATGPHGGEVRLAQSDNLMADQSRYVAYLAGLPPRALLIERPGEAGALSSGRFLRAILAGPSSPAASGLETDACSAAAFDPAGLGRYRLVFLADPGELDDGAWRALAAYVEEGGGLFAWLGPRTPPAALRRHAYSELARHRGLLPGRIEEQVRLDTPLHIRIAQPGHPLLARFRPELLSVLRAVRVEQYLRLAPEFQDPTAAVILELENGAPLLMEKSYGRGRVFCAALGAGTESSSLPKSGEAEAFLSLVLESCRLMAGRGEEAQAGLGRSFTLTVPDPPADGWVKWTRPKEEGGAKETRLAIEPPAPGVGKAPRGVAPSGMLVVPAFKEPGLHCFSWKPGGGGTEQRLIIAANVEAEEADLSRIGAEELAARLAPWNPAVVREALEAPGFTEQAPRGRERPVALLLAVLAVLLFESHLSNRLHQSARREEESRVGRAP